MIYSLEFHPDALQEWQKLPKSVTEQFKKVLKRRLQQPHIPKAKLRGKLKDCYKIKLQKAGYRLVYQVRNSEKVITVITVGKRANNIVYELAETRC